jgi:hypothetical protein
MLGREPSGALSHRRRWMKLDLKAAGPLQGAGGPLGGISQPWGMLMSRFQWGRFRYEIPFPGLLRGSIRSAPPGAAHSWSSRVWRLRQDYKKAIWGLRMSIAGVEESIAGAGRSPNLGSSTP